MAYPTTHMEYDFDRPATTDTVVAALLGIRKNNMLAFMAAVYGGASPELYVAPDSAKGPWETRVYYGLDSFDHTYTNGDADLAFDRVVVSDGFVTLAWNFKWTWAVSAPARLVMTDSYWYVDAGVGRGYEYLGHMDCLFSGSHMFFINWDTNADPHDAPGTED